MLAFLFALNAVASTILTLQNIKHGQPKTALFNAAIGTLFLYLLYRESLNFT